MENREPRVERICALLHNMIPGGSARQWIHLLEHHVAAGGRATIVAPLGELSARAREAGIDLLEVDWGRLPGDPRAEPWPAISAHDTAIVHWDHQVMDALSPALQACGRGALVLHQAPDALARWFGDEVLDSARAQLELALRDPRVAVLTCGAWHRNRFHEAFGIPRETMGILPASIPIPPLPAPAATEPRTVLALIRLSPDKAAVAQLAVELVRARLEAGHDCELAIAGDGPWRASAAALCASRLPPGSWRLEGAPADPIERLAAADLVVAQGLTTLEAAALGRRTVVARAVDPEHAAGVVLTPANYATAAEDPFGKPEVSADTDLIWEQALALDEEGLAVLRQMVEERNSLAVASRALGEALAAIVAPREPA
jgi:hypothetical protein